MRSRCSSGGGFIGGIVGGLIAGFAALWISNIKVPQWARGLMPVVIIPLFASLAVGLLMFLLLGRPLAAITSGLTHWLNGLTGSSVIILGIILGSDDVLRPRRSGQQGRLRVRHRGPQRRRPRVAADHGRRHGGGHGATAGDGAGHHFAAGALFSEPERENGRAAWLLGASFISEGAIPFAAADPLRVIPSMMAGGAVTGALIMAFDVTLKAPHGGIFVFFAIGNLLWFVVALAAGTVVGAVAVIAAKQLISPKAEAAANAAFATA